MLVIRKRRNVFIDQLPLKLSYPLLVVLFASVETSATADGNVGELLEAFDLNSQLSEKTESLVVVLDGEVHDALCPFKSSHGQD